MWGLFPPPATHLPTFLQHTILARRVPQFYSNIGALYTHLGHMPYPVSIVCKWVVRGGCTTYIIILMVVRKQGKERTQNSLLVRHFKESFGAVKQLQVGETRETWVACCYVATAIYTYIQLVIRVTRIQCQTQPNHDAFTSWCALTCHIIIQGYTCH